MCIFEATLRKNAGQKLHIISKYFCGRNFRLENYSNVYWRITEFLERIIESNTQLFRSWQKHVFDIDSKNSGNSFFFRKFMSWKIRWRTHISCSKFVSESIKTLSNFSFEILMKKKIKCFFSTDFLTFFSSIFLYFRQFLRWLLLRYFFLLNLPIISVVSTEFSGFRWFFREFSMYGVFSNFCLFVFRFVFSQNPVEIGQNGYFLQN